MNTVDFVKSLNPSMERVRLTSIISDVRSRLKEQIIPVYKNAEDAFKGRTLQSDPAKSTVAALIGDVSPRFGVNPLGAIAGVLETIPHKLDILEELVNKTFGKEVPREAISYRGASIIQAINTFAFITDYSGTALDRIVAAEVLVAQNEKDRVDEHLVPAVKKYLAENMSYFLAALKFAMIPADQLKDDLLKIPEVTVNPDSHASVQEVVGRDRLDPLKFNFFGLGTNPFYFIGKWFAERQVASYDAAKEEAKQTELRLLELREAAQGRTDPRLQKQIRYNQERLDGLLRKVRKMETDWAHA